MWQLVCLVIRDAGEAILTSWLSLDSWMAWGHHRMSSFQRMKWHLKTFAVWLRGVIDRYWTQISRKVTFLIELCVFLFLFFYHFLFCFTFIWFFLRRYSSSKKFRPFPMTLFFLVPTVVASLLRFSHRKNTKTKQISLGQSMA